MTDRKDLETTEDFFGLPRGALVETKATTYRYEPKTPLPQWPPTPRPVMGANDDECEVCGCWPCMHTNPDDWTW